MKNMAPGQCSMVSARRWVAAFGMLICTLSGYGYSAKTGVAIVSAALPSFSLNVSTSGQEQYNAYCAGCHGPDGRGTGRASRYCTVKPSNLTKLAQNNKGVYPAERVCEVLRNGTGHLAHGVGYMPVWKPLLKSMNGDATETTEVRIKNLAGYIETLQEQPTKVAAK